MTFRQLALLQPALKQLEADALSARAGQGDDRSGWESGDAIKARLRRLVGWWCGSDKTALTSTAAWDVAYAHLLTCFETGRRPGRSPGKWPPAEARLPSPIVLESLGQSEATT